MISFIVSIHCLRTSGFVERMKPSNPAQIALTLIFRPFNACRNSSTRLPSPLPPGSKPTTPSSSMKSSFSFKLSPGAIPSWNDNFNGKLSAAAPAVSLAGAGAPCPPQEAKRAPPIVRAAPLKKSLLVNSISRLSYFLSIGLPGTATVKPLISILPRFKSFGV